MKIKNYSVLEIISSIIIDDIRQSMAMDTGINIGVLLNAYKDRN